MAVDEQSVRSLIDRARATVPSDAELARLLGMFPQALHEVKKGKRHFTDEQLAGLFEVLNLSGEEAREWLARAVIERARAPVQSAMRRAFFVWWVLGVVSALNLLSTNDAAATIDGTSRKLSAGDCLYIVAHWLRHGARTVRRLLRDCVPTRSTGAPPLTAGLEWEAC